jgi:large subunit ribosomal protein L28
MAYACDICKKGTVAGRSQRHKRGVAGKRWKYRAPVTLRVFKPNIQKAMVVIDGKKVSMKLCTKCLKKLKGKKEKKTVK